MGGGFGGKSKVCEQEAIAARLAMTTRRPVKITLDRREEFISGKSDHAKRIRLRTAVAADGTILARSTSIQIDNGAYTAYAPTYVGASRQRTACLYRVQTAHYDCDLVYTNKVPGGQYRGMGAPQTIWAIESHMDAIAAALGRDPLEYRLAQANRTGDVTPLGWRITSCGMSECLAEAARRIGWADKRRNPGPNRGVGIAAMIHPSGGVIYEEGNYSNTRIELDAGGLFVVHTQTADAGTWQNTTLAQIAAEALGVTSEQVRVSHMNTDAAPPDLGSAASRVAFVTGNATALAAQALRETIAAALAVQWQCAPADIVFADGCARHVADSGRSATPAEIAALCGALSAQAKYTTPGERPDPATGIGNYAAAYVFGAQAAEVEVDPATGRITILKIVAAQDVGRALNPIAVEGQIYGGVLQGIGMALQEELVFEEGRPVNASFLDYKVPRIGDAPPIEIALIETNDAEGPFGAKAAAEPTINATIAAIANAVAHATGHRFHQLPMNPERVLGMLAAREARALPLKPWKRPFNAEVAAVRSLYPKLVFPVLRNVGTRFARLPDNAARPELAVPKTLAGLLQELGRPGRRARIVAGGTDMLVGLRQGIYDPDVLVDVTGIAELRGIEEADGWLHIGAATPLAEVLESEFAQRAFPALVEGLRLIATPQIRRVATVAGDLCQEKRCWFFRSAFPCYKLGGSTCPCFAVLGDSRHHSILGARRCAAPCPADLAPILVALDARVVIAGTARAAHHRHGRPVFVVGIDLIERRRGDRARRGPIAAEHEPGVRKIRPAARRFRRGVGRRAPRVAGRTADGGADRARGGIALPGARDRQRTRAVRHTPRCAAHSPGCGNDGARQPAAVGQCAQDASAGQPGRAGDHARVRLMRGIKERLMNADQTSAGAESPYYTLFANDPDWLDAARQRFARLEEGRLESKVRELVFVIGYLLNRYGPAARQHQQRARAHGATDDDFRLILKILDFYRGLRGFQDAQKLVSIWRSGVFPELKPPKSGTVRRNPPCNHRQPRLYRQRLSRLRRGWRVAADLSAALQCDQALAQVPR